LRPQISSRSSLGTRGSSSAARPSASSRQGALSRHLGNPSAAASLNSRTHANLGSRSGVNANLGARTGANLGSRTGTHLGARTGANLGSRTGASLGPRTGTNLRSHAGAGTHTSGRQVSDFLRLHNHAATAGSLSNGLHRGGASNAVRGNSHVSLGSHAGRAHHPSWGNLPGSQSSKIHNNLHTGFRNSINRHGHGNNAGNLGNVNNSWRGNNHNHWGRNDWRRYHPGYGQQWNNWSRPLRNNWYGYRYPWFNNSFWLGRSLSYPWWGNYYGNGGFYGGYYRPYSYWWSYPSWGGLCNWFPNYGWSSPYYYGYGYGGNVVYRDNYVYIDDQPIATTAQYAQSAADLATVDPSTIDPALNSEWLPLGTFALMADKDDVDAPRVVQLVVDKQGIVSGTMYNKSTDKTHVVQGRVDKETQRVAFTIDDNEDVVFETGIYNLTQDETPVLVHFGADRTETFLLVRLEEPKADAARARTSIDELP
jgi:hypothetical protein